MFELKSKKSNNTSSLVTFSENTASSAFLTKGPYRASAPGSSISPIRGLLSPTPLSVIVITTVSINPSPFSSTKVAPSSKVARSWSSKYWKTSPEDFVFKKVVAFIGTGKSITNLTWTPLDGSPSKSVNVSSVEPKENCIGSWLKFTSDSNGSKSGRGFIEIFFNLRVLSAVILPFSSLDPATIDPIDEGAGFLGSLPLSFFGKFAHSKASLNSSALPIGKVTTWSAFLSGIPSPSISFDGKISSSAVGIPSSSGTSSISITTSYGPNSWPNSSVIKCWKVTTP